MLLLFVVLFVVVVCMCVNVVHVRLCLGVGSKTEGKLLLVCCNQHIVCCLIWNQGTTLFNRSASEIQSCDE